MDTTTAAPDARGGVRSAQDACATLVELGRALKGWSFYQAGSPARDDLVERAHRVFRGEIERNGPLALEVRRGAFWLAGTDVAVGVGRLDDLARRLQERNVGRVVFDAEIDPEALTAFLDALAAEPEEVLAAGGFEGVFFALSRRGVSLNDTDWRALRPADSTPVSALDTTLPDVPNAISEEELTFVDSLPGQRDELTMLGEPDAVADPEDADAIDLLDALDLTPVPRSALPTREELAARPPPPSGPQRPLLDELGERLRELDECDSDRVYRDTVRQLVFDAAAQVEQGRFDDPYRLLEALAVQAGDEGKRSFAQRESARESLALIAQGAALGDLVRRACEGDTDLSLRATGVLRELGNGAVARLIDEIEVHSEDPERRSRIAAVLSAMGEQAAPALAREIVSGAPRRQHAAVRLAGEAQNPSLVPSLREVLLGGRPDTAREAAQALVRIGDVTALEALAEAVESATPALASAAAQALAATGRSLAVAPLTAALDRAIAADQVGVARDLVRALGRLARPEAVPALTDLLARGGFFQRRKLRELKVAAVNALTHIPGRAADAALARIEKQGDAQQRAAATLARRRRAHEGIKNRS